MRESRLDLGILRDWGILSYEYVMTAWGLLCQVLVLPSGPEDS